MRTKHEDEGHDVMFRCDVQMKVMMWSLSHIVNVQTQVESSLMSGLEKPPTHPPTHYITWFDYIISLFKKSKDQAVSRSIWVTLENEVFWLIIFNGNRWKYAFDFKVEQDCIISFQPAANVENSFNMTYVPMIFHSAVHRMSLKLRLEHGCVTVK